MPKTRIVRIQDCLHGLMEFRGLEGVVVDVLRTPELQRLRRIKQLGLTHYVFPGAEHSRLAHCLGAAHLAVRFARRLSEIASDYFSDYLCPDEMAIRDLAVAALCHDLGHGPFSHAWEREIIGEDFEREPWLAKLGLANDEHYKYLKWHELVGHAFLAWPDGKLHRLLEQHELGSNERIRNLLVGKYHIPYMPRMLASDVDVDRADFIRRDTLQTGVGYGRYDLEWLISTCAIGKWTYGDSSKWVMGFDARKSIRVVEQFLIARQALYETVYWHKTVRCAEGMMSLFLQRLKTVVQDGTKIIDGRFFGPLVKVINGEALEPHELLSLDDNAIQMVIELVASAGPNEIRDHTLRDLATRISERDLFKLVPVSKEALEKFTQKSDWNQRLCDVVKPFVTGESQFYFFVDHRQFSMLSERERERCYLVYGPERAEPINEHPLFRNYTTTQSIHSLFATREAVPDLKLLIEPKAGR